MTEYRFKPALLRGHTTWTLEGSKLFQDGQLCVDLKDVTSCRFARTKVRYSSSNWLDLNTASGHKRVVCNQPPGDPHYETFHALVTAIFEVLAEVSPDVRVSFGAGNRLRWAFFIMGACMVIFGGVMIASGAAGAVNRGSEVEAMVIGAVFIVPFGLMAWGYRPWKSQVDFDVTTAIALLPAFSGHQTP